ncbi:hypothetical protein BDS110ZK12_27680 [Bradyrhizobium diazoefficiens]|uniref:Uncharacterized protein n=1 Tax=Bradyrhizobium diazoefficiens TaxID=1355477 RepID=A0A810BI71_9BRAD|nr:hypothetical protein XF8B_65870 [Bradyrhizobium diazoefficiens]BCF37574.1 hypothetical protein XF15B_66450 [Bradyrhizobium diazoefficiens]BCF46252.1 hypothetical protein XF16B_67420 [Bradyrhizobium diazoefficiens]BCF72405.1 hypothetical protein XF19B_67580 [Bradyrhizobium diazoefficiens]
MRGADPTHYTGVIEPGAHSAPEQTIAIDKLVRRLSYSQVGSHLALASNPFAYVRLGTPKAILEE